MSTVLIGLGVVAGLALLGLAAMVVAGFVALRRPPASEEATRILLEQRLRRADKSLRLGPLEDGYCQVLGRSPDARTCVANLHEKLVAAENRGEREHVLDQWAGMTLEIGEQAGADRVRAQLVAPGFLETAAAQGLRIVARPVPGLELFVAPVVDHEHSMSYVGADDVGEYATDEDALHELALRNLEATFPVADILAGVRDGSLVRVAAMDGYDAARLLLVPAHLREGEVVAALIPDRDTLALLQAPGDWRSLDELARTPAGDKLLLDRPVRVSAAGFEIA